MGRQRVPSALLRAGLLVTKKEMTEETIFVA
jgi:hypothetical protein